MTSALRVAADHPSVQAPSVGTAKTYQTLREAVTSRAIGGPKLDGNAAAGFSPADFAGFTPLGWVERALLEDPRKLHRLAREAADVSLAGGDLKTHALDRYAKEWDEFSARAAKSILSTADEDFRVGLSTEVERLSKLEDPSEVLSRLQELKGDGPWSLEWAAARDKALAQEWLPKEVLNQVGTDTGEFSESAARLLLEALPTFHGDRAEFLPYIAGWSDAMPATGATSWPLLRAVFERVPEKLRPRLIEEVMTRTLQNAEELARVAKQDLPGAQVKISELLSQHLLTKVKDDPEAARVMVRVESIVSQLPPQAQLRMIAHVIGAGPSGEPAELVRRAFVSMGPIGIKIGQQLSEDLLTPAAYRAAFDELRDKNAKMSRVAAWHLLPQDARDRIQAIGPTLGTGSVKQNLRVVTKEGSRLLSILQPGAEERTRPTLAALKSSPEMGPLMERLAPMIEREFDLLSEAESFAIFGRTALGKANEVSIPKVEAAYPNAIIREAGEGRTHADLARAGPLTRSQRRRKEGAHEQLVRTALDPRKSPDEDGTTYVLTDPHGGNSADDGSRVSFFDLGQYESMPPAEVDTFLHLLRHFATESFFETKLRNPLAKAVQSREGLVKKVTAHDMSGLLDRLAQVSVLTRDDASRSVVDRLDAAYEKAANSP
ncbi:MAG: hypothetical protein ACT4TC_11775, partial [Myxococcaceae bacterium]